MPPKPRRFTARSPRGNRADVSAVIVMTGSVLGPPVVGLPAVEHLGHGVPRGLPGVRAVRAEVWAEIVHDLREGWPVRLVVLTHGRGLRRVLFQEVHEDVLDGV